jgi:hypothetical protein
MKLGYILAAAMLAMMMALGLSLASTDAAPAAGLVARYTANGESADALWSSITPSGSSSGSLWVFRNESQGQTATYLNLVIAQCDSLGFFCTHDFVGAQIPNADFTKTGNKTRLNTHTSRFIDSTPTTLTGSITLDWDATDVYRSRSHSISDTWYGPIHVKFNGKYEAQSAVTYGDILGTPLPANNFATIFVSKARSIEVERGQP